MTNETAKTPPCRNNQGTAATVTVTDPSSRRSPRCGPRRSGRFAAFVQAWNRLQGLNTPALHTEIANWLQAAWEAGERELLLLAFRNSGKSTLVGLFAAWLLAGNPSLRILVLAADFALAKKMVRNVKRIVERHPKTQGQKPQKREQWAADQFTVIRPSELRDPSMLAKGIGANVTGSRADVVIADDVEVPNTCDTAPKREDLRERLGEIDYVLVPGGLQLFVGTPHTYYSIYAGTARRDAGEEAPFLDGFKRLEIPLLDDRGASRWPERFPARKVEGIRRRTGPNKFESQMMLRPVSLSDGRLDPDRLRLYHGDLQYTEGNEEAVLMIGGRRMLSASCWWDPAYGQPGRGDASVVACVFTDAEGDYWLHAVEYLKHDPAILSEVDEATQLCRRAVSFVHAHCLPSVTIETNGIGRFLPGLLRKEMADAGIPAAVIERASTKAKDLRIVDAFDAVLAAGRLHAHHSVWATPFIREMREWRPGGKLADDGLDAVSGCLLSEPVRLSRLPPPEAAQVRARQNWRSGAGAYTARTDFEL